MTCTIAEARARPGVESFANQLSDTLGMISKTTNSLLRCGERGDIRVFLANSHEYMHILGHTVIAWQWLRMAIIAFDALQSNANLSLTDQAFYHGKLHTARFFFKHELVKVEPIAKLCASLDDTNVTMQSSWFF